MSETAQDGASAPQAPAAALQEAPKDVAPSESNAKTAKPAEADGAPKKPSAAELKKQKQAEKQARRAQQKTSGASPNPQKGPQPKEGQKAQKDAKQPPKNEKGKQPPKGRRGSQPSVAPPKDLKKEAKEPPKQVGLFFGHLYNQPRVCSMTGASKDVHPAVLALGLQYSSYVICGSTARMVAMLLAFKAVIDSYQTPVGTSLARHMTAHHLSPQIDYLRSCRPLSISMGNAIRWLKDIIIKIDPSTPEQQAKMNLLEEIDDFIMARVTLADKLIAELAVEKIEAGDVILTYASSAVVERTLLQAYKKGTPFSVVVVDSKPLFEGKRMARSLAKHGLRVKYYQMSGVAHAIKNATKVFLGAHAMMSNGRLFSRVGTAQVSMLAQSHAIPIIVLCESVKFTERVALDSIVGNELAPAEEILSETERKDLLPLKPQLQGETSDNVQDWFKNAQNLDLLQILYDVTPAEYIKMVITEHGVLPASSVPVVHRMSTNV